MTWFYKILQDLPHVPQHLIDRAYAQMDTKLEQMPQGKRQIDWNKITTDTIIVDGVKKINAPNLAYSLDDEMRDWVYANITDKSVVNIRIAKADTGKDGKDTNGAHCDLSRNYSLIYLLDGGGKDHKTVFYHERDKPLMRNNGDRCNDHSLLDIVESFQIPLRTWTVIQTRILHGVRNIPSPRISIQVGLNSVEGLRLVD